jgi:hypothetical protein
VTVKRLAALVVLAFAVAGCGTSKSSNEQPATTAPTSTKPTSPPSMATTPDCQPLPGVSTSPQKSSANENSKTMYLTHVSEDTEASGCSAIVSFTFEPQAPGPGYEVSYQPADTAKIEDGSGNRVEIAGNAFLVVKMMPAMTAKIDGDQVTKTYAGPNRVESDVPSFVKEIVKTGDFESTVTWVIGLDRKLPFKASGGVAGVEIDIDGS